MEGFPHLEHGVVSGIDQGVDGAHARGPQAQVGLVGTRLNLYVFNQAENEAGIEFRIGDLDFDAAFDRWTIHLDGQIGVA